MTRQRSFTGHPALNPASAAELGLASCYDAVDLFTYDEVISTRVEITRRLAEIEGELGSRPTVVFTRLADHPGRKVLANPYPRAVLLSSLGIKDDDWLDEFRRRLSGPSRGWIREPTEAKWAKVGGWDEIPVVWHRPGDAGPYVTAGIGVTASADGSGLNLGFYRVQVCGPQDARIFMDPRTDAYRNLQTWLSLGLPMPISIFLGASPALALIAASRLPAEGDDYDVASRLLQETVCVTGEPPVPVSATHVISGQVLARTAPEGPFGEFKGYYVEARNSNVLELATLRVRGDAPMPTILPGAESGLTLMSMQNEYLMYSHLKGLGYPVDSIRYPLAARGEFLTLIESDEPSRDLLAAAMAFDVRTKVVICGRRLEPDSVWQSLAVHGLATMTEPYYRKGKVEGQRIGILLEIPPTGRPVEY